MNAHPAKCFFVFCFFFIVILAAAFLMSVLNLRGHVQDNLSLYLFISTVCFKCTTEVENAFTFNYDMRCRNLVNPCSLYLLLLPFWHIVVPDVAFCCCTSLASKFIISAFRNAFLHTLDDTATKEGVLCFHCSLFGSFSTRLSQSWKKIVA